MTTTDTHPDDRPPAPARTSKLRAAGRPFRAAGRAIWRLFHSRGFGAFLLIFNTIGLVDTLEDRSAWWLWHALIVLWLLCLLLPGPLDAFRPGGRTTTLTVTFDVDPDIGPLTVPPVPDDTLRRLQTDLDTSDRARAADDSLRAADDDLRAAGDTLRAADDSLRHEQDTLRREDDLQRRQDTLCACANPGAPCPRPRLPGSALCGLCDRLDCPTRP